MSDGPVQPPVQPSEPAPEPSAGPTPTVVVGYPGLTPPSQAAALPPGIAGLRGQVRTLRYLLVACLVLLVVTVVGLGVVLGTSRAQLDDLSARVAALG